MQYEILFCVIYFRNFPSATLVNTSTTQTETGRMKLLICTEKKLKAFLNGNCVDGKKTSSSMTEIARYELTGAVNPKY